MKASLLNFSKERKGDISLISKMEPREVLADIRAAPGPPQLVSTLEH